MRRALLVGVLTAVMVVSTAGAAFAGEWTGNDKDLWTSTIVDPETGEEHHTLHGKSACAFSGQNDEWPNESGDPSQPGVDGFFRTQSWGQLPKAVRDEIAPFGAHPGTACNPSRSAGEPEL